MPTTVLGSRWCFRKLCNAHLFVRVLSLIIFTGLYMLALFVCLAMVLSHMDKTHTEIGLSYAALLLAMTTFFVWDGVRAYRYMFKKRQSETELNLMGKQDAQH